MGRRENPGEGSVEERELDPAAEAEEPAAASAGPQAAGAAPEAEAAGPVEAGGDAVEMERLRAELADMQDRYLRALAEMENVRRRARQEAEEARRYGTERLVADLLPVLDNLQRALEAAEQTSDLEALRSGVELTRRQLTDVLEHHGLRRIPAVGERFDPNLHEAIMQVEPQDGQLPHQVVEELRPGYALNDRVLRPALVKVTSG